MRWGQLSRWVRWGWNRLLFSGDLPAPTRRPPGSPTDLPASLAPGHHPGHWLILAVVPALVLYGGLAAPLLEPDESRYAQLCREMHTHRQWIIPTLQGLPYLDKPPLFYWLVCLSYACFGYQIAAARLVPALALHATILAVYALTRRTLGPGVALRAALVLSALPGFACMGRLITLDGLLAGCVTVSWLAGQRALLGHARPSRWPSQSTAADAIESAASPASLSPPTVSAPPGSALAWAWGWGWWWVACVACGLGVLTKGPVAVVLLLGPVIAWSWLVPAVARVPASAWAVLAAVVLAINLPWYAAMGYLQPQFLGYFLWQHNVLRFLKPFDHLQPVWYYLPILAGGALPLTVALAAALLRSLRPSQTKPAAATQTKPAAAPQTKPAAATQTKPAAASSADRYDSQPASPVPAKQPPVPDHRPPAERMPAPLGYWALAAGWCVLFFSLSGCKLPTYILPAFTALAVLGGFAWARSSRQRAWARLWLASLLGCAAINGLALPWYAQLRSPVADPALIRQWCGDPNMPVICYPRNCDSVAFLLGRDDLRNVRSKHVNSLVLQLLENRRTVVLFTHRHSLEALRYALPKELQIVQTHSLRREGQAGPLGWLITDTPWGLCDLAYIERRD
jgi:4-amino-4-deoxy-L-arabinose transferase-like glycosyltransferase